MKFTTQPFHDLSGFSLFIHSNRSTSQTRGLRSETAAIPRKALRGGIQKSIFKHFLAINVHKMAQRTTRWLQKRRRDAPTKGLAWTWPWTRCHLGAVNHFLWCGQVYRTRVDVGPLGFNFSQHGPTTRPSVQRTEEKAFMLSDRV